jgi:hypothetical protein
MSDQLNNIKERLLKAKEALEKRAPKGVDPDKHESCVIDVKAQGHDVGSAHAICSASMKKDEDPLDAKIRAKLKAEMDKRNFGEADATKHVIDRDRGAKMPKPAKEPKPLLQSEQDADSKMTEMRADAPHGKETHAIRGEACKFDSNGQWSIEKSNYGPKGMGLYSQKDNIQRKMKNTGAEVADAGKNVNVKTYTTSGSTMSAAHEAAETKRRKANPAPVRTLKDLSPEEKARIEAEANKK